MNPFLAAIAIALVSFSGALFTSITSKGWLSRNMSYLITFSGGVFLITTINLAQEAFEILDASTAIFSILGGFILLWIAQIVIPETHEHTDIQASDRLSKSGIKVLIGDGIHNIGDGVLLVPAFALSPSLGLVVAFTILVHEFIQEISEFFVLRASGYSTRKALSLNFLSALTILIGVAIGWSLVNNEGVQGLLLGIAAGAFLQIVVYDLFPFTARKQLEAPKAWRHLGLFLSGALVMLTIGSFTPHAHEQEDERHELPGDHLEVYLDHEDDHDDD